MVIIWIDGSIAAFRAFELAKSAAHLERRDLTLAGFVIIEVESNFIPKAKEKWLGVITDTTNLIFTVP